MAAGDITVVGSDKSTENNTGSSTVQWADLDGAGLAAGDLCVLFWEHSNAATETVTPTSQGFTQIDTVTDGTSVLTAYKKTCAGSETGSITVTTSVVGRKSLFGIVLRGALDVAILNTGGDAGTDANHTPPAATPTSDGCGALIALGEHSGTAATATPPSGYTEVLEENISGSGASFGYIAYKGSAGLLDKLTNGVAETPGNIVSDASGSNVTYMTLIITPGTKTGAATGAISWSAVATGKRVAKGLAVGAIAWAGVAAGAVAHRGASTGAISWSGATAGVSTHKGAATGAISWSGTAAGARASRGAATGALTWSATAAGTRASRGAATGAVTWSGTAAGARRSAGGATGAVTWVGVANGQAPVVGGAAGSAGGAVTWAGAAAGARASRGGASGSCTWVTVAHGVRVPKGSAAGAIAWTGSASGVIHPAGAASGALAWIGVAAGQAPIPEDQLRDITATGILIRDWHATLDDTGRTATLDRRGRTGTLQQPTRDGTLEPAWRGHLDA